ncbi:MAG: hypothetical protein QOH47_2399 [Sphingomonadales bacterium]|jgi:hypothetical protein|nr:hypothetical protein [Sphingomonadales bacterium]
MNATGQCHHPDLHFDLHHVSLADSNTHYLELKAKCNVCGARMIFQGEGLPFGCTPKHPTLAIDGGEINIPMRGEGEEPTGSQISMIGSVST